MNLFDRLREAIREACASAEARHEEAIRICHELHHDVDFYEMLLSRKGRRGGGR